MSYKHASSPSARQRRGELLLLRRSLNRLQDEARLLRRDLLLRKYSPDQPRVPAGGPGGGRWTAGGDGGGGGAGGLAEFAPDRGEASGRDVVDDSGNESWASYSEGFSDDGAVFERDVLNRDGSMIHSEYAASRAAGFDERQTVTLKSGENVAFETTDLTQTLRYGGPDGEVVGRTLWTPSGPGLESTIQPAFAPMVAAPTLIIGGAILFNWQSLFNGSDGQQAVMGFEAREFRPSASGTLDLSFSGRVSQEEAEAACKYLPEMQARLDDVVARAGPVSDYPSPAVYGTYVHQRLREQIDATGRADLQAEVSASKIAAETAGAPPPPYGFPRTIRIDAVEYREDGTVCIYDFKTGKAGMTRQRFSDVGRGGMLTAEQPRRAIVIQVRPNKR